MTDAALVTRRPWAGALIAVGVLVTRGPRRPLRQQAPPGAHRRGDRPPTAASSQRSPATLVHIITVADPRNVAIMCVVIGAVFFWRGRRRLALLSGLGPLVAVALTDLVLKPLINRKILGVLSFPSGHTTASVALATVIAVGMLGASRPSVVTGRALVRGRGGRGCPRWSSPLRSSRLATTTPPTPSAARPWQSRRS